MARNGSARAGACVVLVVCGALLAGCDGGSDPTTSAATASVTSTSAAPTSSSSPASSSSTSASASESATSEAYVPVKPKFPAAAKKQTDEGAVAFVEYYWQAVDYAWGKPDSEILPPLSASSCESCSDLMTTASNAVRNGESVTGPVLEARDVSIASSGSGKTHLIFDLHLFDVKFLDKSGKILFDQKDKDVPRAIEVVWSNGWKAQTIGTR